MTHIAQLDGINPADQVLAQTPLHIEPGGLYLFTVPRDLSQEAYDEIRATFASERAVLTPQATFLLMSEDYAVQKVPPEYLDQQIAALERVKARLATRAAPVAG